MDMESSRVVRPDNKGRILLGELAKGISSFRVFIDDEQRIILEPFAEIPAREKWLFENKKSLASVMRGLQQSKNKKTKSLGSFSKFTQDN